jgi:hypothetical protein
MNDTAKNQKILILGNGRLSRHLRHYFTTREIPWTLWSRQESVAALTEKALGASAALLAVSDGAIEEVAGLLPEELLKIHFSGIHVSEKAFGVHPLMTFSPHLLEPQVYDRIPLVVDPEILTKEWLRNLPNPKWPLKKEDRALYHGLCHLAGNYSKWILEQVCRVFEGKLELPRTLLQPFLEQSLLQVMKKETDLNAGPFGRKDQKTIQDHLRALETEPALKSLYLQYYDAYQKGGPT